jgi:glycogen debranching enzyme
VLLPEGFALNLAFKQHYWLDEQYLAEALIGRSGDRVEQILPGPHAHDGSYTRLDIRWEQLDARVETATAGSDLVVLVTPESEPSSPVKLVVETGMLWNRPGALSEESSVLIAELSGRTIRVYTTRESVFDPYVETLTPHLVLPVEGPLGVSTGTPRSLDQISRVVAEQRTRQERDAATYGDLAEAFTAIQAAISWNTIYEPKLDRVVSTVGRLWNEEYGGYALFGWDNFFIAYMTALYSRDLAYANVIEHLRGKTEQGFIPNDNGGNGRKSWDHSQPPVGGIMVKETYKRYPERWFLEATFDDLLDWNRWWPKQRLNNGLLSYGSHTAKNPFSETHRRTMRAAGYESGMDDSPMYEGVAFNQTTNTMELQDVGLNSLYIADCLALAEIANVLGRQEEALELHHRAERFAGALEGLWDEEIGFYLNRHSDTGRLSRRLSPTLFYPMLASVPDTERVSRMVRDHFFNPEEFWGEWVLPSISRNDPTFERQRYWKGAIWPPLNFLSYLSLRQYDQPRAQRELSERSLRLFLSEWARKGYVSENYSSISGTGDDSRLSSDRFHSWGALFGMIAFIERGIMPAPERAIQ